MPNPLALAYRPKNKFLLCLRWPIGWLLDRHSDLSTSKIMAFAILAAFWTGKEIPSPVVGLLLATAFGYSAWKDWVAKGTWAMSSTESREEKIVHTITEQRGPTGEPLKSNPPVVGAKTLSGDE